MNKLRWGVLSTAKIGREKVIPAMMKGQFCEVVAIASRNEEQAKQVANELGIAKHFGSYSALLADADIDAVYIPLPNHLHVLWAIKALQAGKHVLCEKPIALSKTEAEELQDAAALHPHLVVMEAFMYRFHPQWIKAKELVDNGSIGELKTIQSFFSYYNDNPENIRNKPETGGGGMMDIGCYCVSLSRWLFGKEPLRVLGLTEYDSILQTDKMASGILDFGNGSSTFTCSTQLMPFQRVNIIGNISRIELELPFNALSDKQMLVTLFTKNDTQAFYSEAVDQYTLQVDLFSQAALNKIPVPTPLQDAVDNMTVIEAILVSGREGVWINV